MNFNINNNWQISKYLEIKQYFLKNLWVKEEISREIKNI